MGGSATCRKGSTFDWRQYPAHNAIRDQLASQYHKLPPMECRFCGGKVSLPTGMDIKTEFIYVSRHQGKPMFFVADIAALDDDGKPLAVVEIVASHKPREVVVEVQSRLPAAFYLLTDAFECGGFKGWCSSYCWQARDEQFSSCLPRCDACDAFLPKSAHVFRDWSDDPYYGVCIRCAAAAPGTPQWNPPGDIAFGHAGLLPQVPAAPASIFLAWSTANFWSMVWNTRVGNPTVARTDESATSKQLDEIEAAFLLGSWADWSKGAELLQPVGNRWLQEGSNGLWAWDPKNCRRVAQAWGRLADYLLSYLPSDIQQIITSRIEPSISDRTNIEAPEFYGDYDALVPLQGRTLDDVTGFLSLCKTCGMVGKSGLNSECQGFLCDDCWLVQVKS